MTINDLIAEIHVANCALIEVERLQFRAGNAGGVSNHDILKLRMGEREITFDNSTGTWASEA